MDKKYFAAEKDLKIYEEIQQYDGDILQEIESYAKRNWEGHSNMCTVLELLESAYTLFMKPRTLNFYYELGSRRENIEQVMRYLAYRKGLEDGQSKQNSID